jgi:two-component system chemotaxis sensor kinase CheA
MADAPDLKEFVEGFLVEAEEHLAVSAKNLVALDASGRQGDPNPRAVRELFRSLHTLKGLAAMVGVEPIVDVAHEMETILRNADRSAGRLTPEALDLLQRGLKAIEERVGQLGAKKPVAPAPAALLDALAEIQGNETGAVRVRAEIGLEPETLEKLSPAERLQLTQGVSKGERALRLEFVPSKERSERGLNITHLREQTSRHADIVKVVPRALPASQKAPGGLSFVLVLLSREKDDVLLEATGLEASDLREIAITPAVSAEPAQEVDGAEAPSSRPIIRVEAARLDDAMEKLSALVVTRFKLDRAVAALGGRGADVRELQAILSENGRQLRDLRGAILRARLVRVAELIERLPLVVRGLARASGKIVRVELDAGDAELDKAVAERIFPSLVHLVRNAVDHGLEHPEAREKAGKPREGVVRVSAATRGDRLLLEVADDGAGIDAAAVARRAGIPAPNSDAALLEILTRPGFSTREVVSEVSGRGMGMDIVLRTVDELGGQLTLTNRPGVGTAFALQVPLSVSIVDALTFESKDQAFVAPVSAVEEILEVEPGRVVTPPGRGGRGRFLERRGEAVPYFSLAHELGLCEGDVLPRKALLVRRDGAPYVVGVDRMLGAQEVVVRPLEDPLVKVPGVTGATDLGDGKPTLVLDLVSLVGRFGRGAGAR